MSTSNTIGSAATASATTSTTGTTPTDYSQTNKSKTGSEFGMDKDAFLKILVEQLKNQDPSSPGDSTQYVQQMTSYAMLEQLTNVSQAMQVQQSNNAGTTATGLMGHTVTYVDEQGNEQSGEVKAVSFKDSSGPTLTIGDKSGISLGQITEVGGLVNSATPATNATTSTTTSSSTATPPTADATTPTDSGTGTTAP
jgi:flagellar basal-body rod modification protein FlgD